MKSGIYMITCNETNKVYIGSSKNMKSRYQAHLSDLKRGRHGNPYMINAFKKYGKETFQFSIIEHCEPQNLLEKEYFWMSFYDSTNPDKGFNIIRDPKREKDKEEKCNSITYKEKLRMATKKRWKDPEYREKMTKMSRDNWKDPEFAAMNISQIQKAHKERKAKEIPLAIHLEEAKKKSRISCSTPEFLKGLSERGRKQLEDPEQRKIALKTLEEGRNNPLRLENLRKAKQDPDYKKMIAEKTRLSWIKRREKRVK